MLSKKEGRTERELQEPGEERAARDGLTALNNIIGKSPEDVALEHENLVRSKARDIAEAAGRRADLAPSAAVDDGPSIEKKVVMGGEEVTVVVPRRTTSAQVQKFGPESRLPIGTHVRKDGSPCADGETPFGVVGNINTKFGILVSRVIPVEMIDEQLGGEAA